MNATGSKGRADLIRVLMGLAQGDQQRTMDRLLGILRKTVGQATNQLAGTLGEQFTRKNVAIPAGTQMLATKYMAPAVNQMQSVYDYLQEPNKLDTLSKVLSIADSMGSNKVNLNTLQQVLSDEEGDYWWKSGRRSPGIRRIQSPQAGWNIGRGWR